MKLIKCYISSFGKLKDFEYDFNDGVNCINEPNGFGKTTLTVFLKSMFYGLKDSARNVEENERVKYRPWGSTEKFGGYIVFEINNKQYKIERYFATKRTDDSVTLTEISTGKTYTDSKETIDLGKRLFKIDEDGYLSTTFFSQKNFEIKNNSSITNKFNSTLEEDSAIFDKAMEKLKEEAKTFKMNGDKGLIPETNKKILELKEEIEKGKNLSAFLDNLNVEKNNYSKKIEELSKENERLSEKQKISASKEANLVKKENLSKLNKNREAIFETYSYSKDILNGNELTIEKISYVKELISDYNKHNTLAKDCKEDIETFKAQNEQKPQLKPKKINVLTIISMLLALGGVGAIFINTILGIALISIGAIGVIASLFIHKKPVVNPNNEYLESKERKYNELAKLCEDEKGAITEFLSKFNVEYNSYDDAIDNLKKAVNDYSISSLKIKEIDGEIAKLTNELSLYKDDSNVENLTEIDEKLSANKKAYEDAVTKLKEIDSSIRYYDDKVATLSDKEGELVCLSENIITYKEKYELLTKTIDFLNSADENLRIKYRKPLNDSFNKYISYITDKQFNADIDIELNISIQEKNGSFESDYYSQGYKNLFDICKRFALTDILFNEEKPFIILDDPFYNLDGKNLDGALKLLNQLGNNYQIIYLVCHKSREA